LLLSKIFDGSGSLAPLPSKIFGATLASCCYQRRTNGVSRRSEHKEKEKQKEKEKRKRKRKRKQGENRGQGQRQKTGAEAEARAEAEAGTGAGRRSCGIYHDLQPTAIRYPQVRDKSDTLSTGTKFVLTSALANGDAGVHECCDSGEARPG
jgi:hypothetical protein